MILKSYRLRVVGGRARGQSITICKCRLPLLVGRGNDSDARLRDPYMSRKHFLIDYRNGGFRIVDQCSQTGTRVNQQPVETASLRPGDEIAAGATVFRFEGTLFRPWERLKNLVVHFVCQIDPQPDNRVANNDDDDEPREAIKTLEQNDRPLKMGSPGCSNPITRD